MKFTDTSEAGFETTIVDKTISRSEREVELIAEYRSRLVSDVVTGKVDVRNSDIPNFEVVEADLEILEDEKFEQQIVKELSDG